MVKTKSQSTTINSHMPTFYRVPCSVAESDWHVKSEKIEVVAGKRRF